MHSDSNRRFVTTLTTEIGADPASLDWPREFRLAGENGHLRAIFDPQNALLTLYGATTSDFRTPALAWVLTAGREALNLCSRVLVHARGDADTEWVDLGFGPEGLIEGYWPDGEKAGLWARAWGRRASDHADDTPSVGAQDHRRSLPPRWVCRPATIADAAGIGTLLRSEFSDYRIPEDPGVIRYALASEAVHGRVICRPDGSLAAYASVEFQPDGGAVEITDCATAAAERGQGLMTHLVTRLASDLVDVFGGCGAYCLAREDQPGMQAVLVRCGWRRTGRLVNHFRVGDRWLSANLWQAAPADQAEI